MKTVFLSTLASFALVPMVLSAHQGSLVLPSLGEWHYCAFKEHKSVVIRCKAATTESDARKLPNAWNAIEIEIGTTTWVLDPAIPDRVSVKQFQAPAFIADSGSSLGPDLTRPFENMKHEVLYSFAFWMVDERQAYDSETETLLQVTFSDEAFLFGSLEVRKKGQTLEYISLTDADVEKAEPGATDNPDSAQVQSEKSSSN